MYESYSGTFDHPWRPQADVSNGAAAPAAAQAGAPPGEAAAGAATAEGGEKKLSKVCMYILLYATLLLLILNRVMRREGGILYSGTGYLCVHTAGLQHSSTTTALPPPCTLYLMDTGSGRSFSQVDFRVEFGLLTK